MIVTGFAFELVIAFSAADAILIGIANEDVIAEITNECVSSLFANQGVSKNIALGRVVLVVARYGAIASPEEAWIDD